MLDEATATEGGALLAEMEGTTEMVTGVGVEVDPPAFEAVPGTMVAQTSWVQSGELLPDLLLSSLGFEGEGPLKGGLDKSVCSSPGEMRPQLELLDPSTSRHTLALDDLGEMQRGPLPPCRTSDKLIGGSLCPESTPFCFRAVWTQCLLLHSESLEYAELTGTLLLPGLLSKVPVPEWSEQGSVCPPPLVDVRHRCRVV